MGWQKVWGGTAWGGTVWGGRKWRFACKHHIANQRSTKV